MTINVRAPGNSGFLLKDVAVDTNGDGFNVNGATMPFAVWATNFGGGTVALQGSPDGGVTWIQLLKPDGNPATYTVNSIDMIDRFAPGMLIRATLNGSAGASGVYVQTFE